MEERAGRRGGREEPLLGSIRVRGGRSFDFFSKAPFLNGTKQCVGKKLTLENR